MFFITFKSCPPTPKKCIFLKSIDLFSFCLPHFIKILTSSQWNVCSVLRTPQQAWALKIQGTSFWTWGGAPLALCLLNPVPPTKISQYLVRASSELR